MTDPNRAAERLMAWDIEDQEFVNANDYDALRAEVVALRGELDRIATFKYHGDGREAFLALQQIAREATRP